MKWVLFAVLLVLVAVVGGATFFPMSVAADFLAKQRKDFHFAQATGSVWDGKLQGVRFGNQDVGDVAVKTDLGSLFVGKPKGTLGIVRKEYSGIGTIAYAINGGEFRVSNLKIDGKVAALPGLPQTVRQTDGKFSVQVSDLVLGSNACKTAVGEVWTDALAKVDIEGKWVGPELRGPVTCKDGHVVVEAKGKAATGEDVAALVSVGSDLSLDMSAKVEGATAEATEVLQKVGFTSDGPTMTLHRSLSGH